MPEKKLTSHLTQHSSLASTINSWEMFRVFGWIPNSCPDRASTVPALVLCVK